MNDTDYLFTATDRAKTCIHEAAHAVINALGGAFVTELAVRPAGSKSWQHTNGKSRVRTDIDGICCVDYQHSAKHPYLFWSDEINDIFVNSAGYKKEIQRIADFLESQSKKYLIEERRQVRADVCGRLAGPIADAILDVSEIDLLDYQIENNDICNAKALCAVLPYKNEDYYLAAETERLLRTPEIWDRILKLAAALETAGTLFDDDIPFLPDPIPNWPPSPYSRKK